MTDFMWNQVSEGEELLDFAIDEASYYRDRLLNSIIDKAMEESYESIRAALECIAHGNDKGALQALEAAIDRGAILRAIEYNSPLEIAKREAQNKEEIALMNANE